MVTLDEMREWSFDQILEHGHGIVRCPATDAIPAPYAYTVGRTLKERPELIVTGMEGEPATRWLNELALVDDVIGLTAGESLIVGGVLVRCIESYPGNLLGAYLQFGQFSALQVLLPDANGEFPDSLKGRTSAQPLLPAIPEDAWDPYDEEGE